MYRIYLDPVSASCTEVTFLNSATSAANDWTRIPICWRRRPKWRSICAG